MSKNIKTALGALLLSLFITSCSSLPSWESASAHKTDEPEKATMPVVRSGVSVCGGSFTATVTANLQSEYKKLTTKVDASFKQYVYTVLTANNISQAQRDAFINCIVAVEEKQFARFALAEQEMACDDVRQQCASVKPGCIKIDKNTCFDNCDNNKMMMMSRNACMDECAFGDFNTSTYSKECTELVANCETEYATCMGQ